MPAGRRPGASSPTKRGLPPAGTPWGVQGNAFVAITGETDLSPKVVQQLLWRNIGVRNLLLLFAQVFHKAKGLINKLPCILLKEAYF